MSSKNFKIGMLAILLLISVLILGVVINTGLAYLIYGVLLALIFPDLPTLTFIQYIAIGSLITIIGGIFNRGRK